MARFDIERWKAMRQECRVDLWRLCQVLGYKDVGKPHIRIYKHLQRFEGGTEPLKVARVKDGAGYVPKVSMWRLPGKRKRAKFVTRGGLKTTIITQAEKIQWILNYPDVRILTGSAQLGRAKDFLKGIKEPFTKNELFRWLFPEYCPKISATGNMEDFGNDEQFTVPCRRKSGIKEPTVRVCSADSSVAGGHYDVVDFDDGVEDQNTRTPSGIEQLKKFFGSLWPLVETSPEVPGEHGWLNLTGTIYNFSDLHFSIYSAETKKPADKREWDIVYIPACTDYEICKKAYEEQESAKERGNPYEIQAATEKLDGLTKKHIWWPQRIPIEALVRIERDPALGPGVLYPQYLLRPLQDKNGLIATDEDIKWISRKELNALKPRITWNCTIDLAGMGTSQGSDTDYECLNLHGWGTDGRCYFDKIIWGRLDPDTVIDWMFKIFAYCPQLIFFKIEAEAHARVLAPYLRKAMAKKQIYLPIMEIKRDNMVSKQHRIRGTQPYWKNGAFRFAEDIDADAREQLKLEAKYFPKFNHDDILDTIADALQSRDGITADVEGRGERSFDGLDYVDQDGAERTWKGIPVENLSWQALGAMEEETESSAVFQPW